MPTVLLDTNVVSFLFKGDTRGLAYLPLLAGHSPLLSFMTVVELFQWAGLRKWGTRRIAALELMLTGYALVPADLEMCRIWGRIRASQASVGRVISAQDAWIAATALRHNLPVITHNASDYHGIPNLDVRTAP